MICTNPHGVFRNSEQIRFKTELYLRSARAVYHSTGEEGGLKSLIYRESFSAFAGISQLFQCSPTPQ